LDVDVPFVSTLKITDYITTTYTKTSFASAVVQSHARDLIYRHEADGACSWVVRNNDTELFRLSGGFMQPYYREISAWDNPSWASSAPADISVERGWLTDCDLRTNSYILEKRNTKLIPTEPLDKGVWISTFETSYMLCAENQEDSLIIAINNEVVVNEVKKERAPTINAFELWLWGFPPQLMPRFYSCDNGYEEQVGVPSRRHKYVDIFARRYEYPWNWDFYPLNHVSGQLQSRFSDVMVSAADSSMSWSKGIVNYELTYFKQREPAWNTIAVIGDAVYPVLENLAILLAEETPPGENFRLTSIVIV
jgi:hypothetical protein